MAQITRVNKAQQRYRQIQVLNEDGSPKRTQMMDSRTGEPKLTKAGEPMFMPVRVRDIENPLPMPRCEKCRREIKVGEPYKHTNPRSGPFSGSHLIRCNACPDWQVWDYSDSVGAQVARIAYDAREAAVAAMAAGDVAQALSDAAEAVRELASEKEAGAENVREGFGHDTHVSESLDEVAESLNTFADELESVDIPDGPEDDAEEAEEAWNTWRDEVDEVLNVLDNFDG